MPPPDLSILDFDEALKLVARDTGIVLVISDIRECNRAFEWTPTEEETGASDGVFAAGYFLTLDDNNLAYLESWRGKGGWSGHAHVDFQVFDATQPTKDPFVLADVAKRNTSGWKRPNKINQYISGRINRNGDPI